MKSSFADKIRYNASKIFNQQTASLDDLTISVDKFTVPREIRKGVFHREYEKQERHLIRTLDLSPSDRVLDLGTCVGVVAITAAKLVGSKNVQTHEANPALEPIIRKNFALNNVDPALHMVAVTKDGRDIELHLQKRVFSSSVFPRDSKGAISVKSVAISDIINAFGPTIISMDVEGAEAEIVDATDFPGVRAAMLEVHPHVIGELKAKAVLDRFASLGFLERNRMGDTYLFTR
ncbi:FkbM family methyltransferase [Aquamicrobium defluvii]|uniref:FkbM family methyltransferase n=1 Tax=Aquamicrobium defluvii TaxID=69279 RepID=A0A4R6YIK3_9HYPH|nr:FkbM family methyltransferase [Aquamicrobium defluvii]TDR36531.1 FkbM family methyltransferase [Aquamicrobium defluvii]